MHLEFQTVFQSDSSGNLSSLQSPDILVSLSSWVGGSLQWSGKNLRIITTQPRRSIPRTFRSSRHPLGVTIMSDIKYRQAIDDDVLKIVKLWKEFIDFHKARDSFFSRSKEGPENFRKFIAGNLQKDDSIVIIAEINGNVVAYLLATIHNYPPVFEIKRYGIVNDLAVTSDYRRIGIGQHLFHMAKDWFFKKGISRIEIEVAVANEVSASFWGKRCFRQ
jgi:ribosomal protein S18 acetylase RimI-like enzyme